MTAEPQVIDACNSLFYLIWKGEEGGLKKKKGSLSFQMKRKGTSNSSSFDRALHHLLLFQEQKWICKKIKTMGSTNFFQRETFLYCFNKCKEWVQTHTDIPGALPLSHGFSSPSSQTNARARTRARPLLPILHPTSCWYLTVTSPFEIITVCSGFGEVWGYASHNNEGKKGSQWWNPFLVAPSICYIIKWY